MLESIIQIVIRITKCIIIENNVFFIKFRDLIKSKLETNQKGFSNPFIIYYQERLLRTFPKRKSLFLFNKISDLKIPKLKLHKNIYSAVLLLKKSLSQKI